MTVACIVVVSAKRAALVEAQVLPSVLDAQFDEVVVVGDFTPGRGYRYCPVPPLTKTTTDALVKRDVGTLATTADWLFYLCDDHALRFAPDWRAAVERTTLDVGVPQRYSMNGPQRIACNMGLDFNDPNRLYCGGHAGLFRRALVQAMPWTTMPHDRLWDLLASRAQMANGYRFGLIPELLIEDLEPEAKPWQ